MSVRHTYLFDRSGEFRFPTDRVELASAVARIRELGNASTDHALAKTIEATSAAADHPASHMVDGKANTFWGTVVSGPHEVELDLGRLIWLNRLELEFALGGLPSSAILYLSEDGIDFDEIANLPSVSDDIDQTFTAVRARYAKLVFTDSDDTLQIIRLSLKGPTQYYDDKNLYLLTPAVMISAAEELLQSAGVPAQTGIRYFWIIDGVAKYFDGAAWVNSDRTWDQASALTDLPPLGQNSWVRLGVVLRSLDGTARPTITSCTLAAAAPAPALQDKLTCLVSGYLRDATGDPLAFREIEVVASKGATLPVARSVQSDDRGYFEITLERGLEGVKFRVYPEGTTFIRNIPNATTANFEELT
ncbi:MAG: discoidin domain-containing protein [Spirochaetes bacterium]|nr:discoidin domain-containing protein [Spirochaetota bacterium]